MCREHVVKPSDNLGKKGNVKKPKEQLWTAVLHSTGGKTNLEMDEYLVILKCFISMRSACKTEASAWFQTWQVPWMNWERYIPASET